MKPYRWLVALLVVAVLGVIGAWRTLGGKGFNYPWHFRLLH